MTFGFAFSKVLQILWRLWGVDTSASLASRDARADTFARAAVRRIYSRNEVRVAIALRRARNRE